MPTVEVTVTGYEDLKGGHTAYNIETGYDGKKFLSQHRFSDFPKLHKSIASKLIELPFAFPVAKSVFSGDKLKRARVDQLQTYLRECADYSGDNPP